MIEVKEISPKHPYFPAYRSIRHEVFVGEQKVPEEAEFDEFEDVSRHFLALENGDPVGTARWRRDGKRFKLERFAVLKESRGKGIGKELVLAIEESISSQQDLQDGDLFMHAQIDAVGFYKGLGYSTIGDEFIECGIRHLTMIK